MREAYFLGGYPIDLYNDKHVGDRHLTMGLGPSDPKNFRTRLTIRLYDLTYSDQTRYAPYGEGRVSKGQPRLILRDEGGNVPQNFGPTCAHTTEKQ